MTEGLAQRLHSLLPTVKEELQIHDTEHPVFHGCWDWHSSVHGHWALLQGAHALGDNTTVEWIASRLESEAMASEFADLQSRPEFERPYGRAWLLRLMLAYQSITGRNQCQASTHEVAKALVEWLKTVSQDATISEYANPSWALIQLYAWATYVNDPEMLLWVQDTVEKHYRGHSTTLESDGVGKGEFFSQWSLQALLQHSVLGAQTLQSWVDEQDLDVARIQPILSLNTNHHLGVNASRAWGCWAAFDATQDPRWERAYKAHVEASLALHPQWVGDRRAYAHWVPQFTVYALLMSVLHS